MRASFIGYEAAKLTVWRGKLCWVDFVVLIGEAIEPGYPPDRLAVAGFGIGVKNHGLIYVHIRKEELCLPVTLGMNPSQIPSLQRFSIYYVFDMGVRNRYRF